MLLSCLVSSFCFSILRFHSLYVFIRGSSEIAAAAGQETEVNEGADEDNLPATGPGITTDISTISQHPRVVKDVVTNLRLAMGYDEISQFKSDGFDVSCCMLSDGGFEGDKDEMWKFHIMSISENLAAAAVSSSSSAAKVEGESAAEQNEESTVDGAAAPAGDAAVAAESKDVDVTVAGEGLEPPPASEEGAAVVDETVAPLSMSAPPSAAVLGVEDVVWVSVSKASGAAAAVPEGYSLLSETDLAPAEDADSVYLAVKMGPTPRIAGIRMYCTATAAAAAGGDADPPALDALIANCFPGREMAYRAAPRAIEAMHSGPCGLLLEVLPESALAHAAAEEDGGVGAVGGASASSLRSAKGSKQDVLAASASAPGTGRRLEGGVGVADAANAAGGSQRVSDEFAVGGERGGEGEEDPYLMGDFGGVPVTVDDDDEAEAAALTSTKRQTSKRGRKTEEYLVNELEARLLALETEKTQIQASNLELQKKAAALIAKEKATIQSKNVASGLGNAGGQGDEQTAAAAMTANDLQTMADAEAEKEKMYVETLQKIVNGRVKLERQQSEFDQLSLDLQTRLDDKEFKAGEIKEYFLQFKKEIFAKAQNSRTGNKIPKSVVEAFEAAEQARDDALEKVRLRNISLRTTLRKLERTYRSREQLADGLHMIDFEQLKIENQTLHEKIEERNEELAKLKRKKTVTVQVLTHVREKLRFYEQNNKADQGELNALETDSMKLRAEVSSTKKGRDALRDDNKDLKLKQGFASNDLLIADFERRKRTVYVTKDKIRDLQERYRALSAQVVPYESMGPKGTHSHAHSHTHSHAHSHTHSQAGTAGSKQPGGTKATTMYPPTPGQLSGGDSKQY